CRGTVAARGRRQGSLAARGELRGGPAGISPVYTPARVGGRGNPPGPALRRSQAHRRVAACGGRADHPRAPAGPLAGARPEGQIEARIVEQCSRIEMVPARHAFHSFFVHVPDGIMTADMERGMIRKRLLSLAGAAAAGCMVFGMAQAAPATGALEGLKTLALTPGNVE